MATAAYIVQCGQGEALGPLEDLLDHLGLGSAIVVKAVAVRVSVPTGSVTLTSASVAEHGVRDAGGDLHLAGQRLRLAGEGLAQGLRVGADDLAAAGLGHRLEGLERLALLGDRDDVDQDLAVPIAAVTSASSVSEVSAPSESTSTRALALVAGQVDGGEHAVVEAGLLGQRQPVDDRPRRFAVLARRQRRLDVGVEGDDADVDVVGNRVEERQRGRLGLG